MAKYKILGRERHKRRRVHLLDVDAESAREAIAKAKKRIKVHARFFSDWQAKKYVGRPKRRRRLPLGLRI